MAPSARLILALWCAVSTAGAQSADSSSDGGCMVSQKERQKLQKPKTITPLESPASVPEHAAAEAGGIVEDADVDLPPAIRARVLADAAERAGKSDAEAVIAVAQAVTWPDGSLGCPEKGMRYPQLPVSGYRVVVRAGERSYDYRVATAARSQVSGTALQVRYCAPGSGVRAVEKQ